MAIEGSYNFKGITVADSYIKVTNTSYNQTIYSETYEKTAAVYNSDGTLKTAAVMDTRWVTDNLGHCSAKVYKDKAARDADPDSQVTSLNFSYPVVVTASGKNPVKQAYDYIKTTDAYKDYKDV
tara:strand:+ start:2109 stop:2480 length:372 start_codon:yes stop_codon:yes gene_type:complete